MGGAWQLSFPITSFHSTTRTLCRPGVNRVFITSDAGPSCAGQTRTLHIKSRSSHLSSSRCLQSLSEPSIRRPRPFRTNTHSVRRQRGWKLISQLHGSSLAGPTQGRCRGPNQRRHLSRTPTSSQQPAQEHHTPPTYINLCAGIGAFHLVLKKNGLKCVYANEPDPESRPIFELNHAQDLSGLTHALDHRDITKVPQEHIPDHTLLAAWVPFRHGASQLEQRASWRTRALEVVEAKNPLFVLVGTAHFRRGGIKAHGPPPNKAESYMFLVNTARELEALGYRTTFGCYDYASFDVPLSRHGMFIVGVPPDQSAPFEFKPPPGRSTGLGLHRFLVPPETIQHVQSTSLMKTELVDDVWTLQRNDATGTIGRLAWTKPDALPPSDDKTQYVLVGHWLNSDNPKSSSQPICHHRGFARGIGEKHWYLVPGPDGRPMVRQLFLREKARLQGFPDEFLLHGTSHKVAQQIGDSAPPPMLDWIVKAMKDQYPHIFSTGDKRAPKIEAGSHA